MSQRTKRILTIGIIFLSYGYLCRELSVYFFWGSKTIGWILLLAALLSYWIDLRRVRRQQRKKIVWVTIGIVFVSLTLIIFLVTVFILRSSDAYSAATEYLKSDIKIKDEVGVVKGFGLIPTGVVQLITRNGVESGSAILEIIIIGDKKNKDVISHLEKTPDKFWTVTDIK